MMENIEGVRFLSFLRNELSPNHLLGYKYHFIKWMPTGGIQIRINESQQKAIHAVLLMLAYHINIRNNRLSNPIVINQQ